MVSDSGAPTPAAIRCPGKKNGVCKAKLRVRNAGDDTYYEIPDAEEAHFI